MKNELHKKVSKCSQNREIFHQIKPVCCIWINLDLTTLNILCSMHQLSRMTCSMSFSLSLSHTLIPSLPNSHETACSKRFTLLFLLCYENLLGCLSYQPFTSTFYPIHLCVSLDCPILFTLWNPHQQCLWLEFVCYSHNVTSPSLPLLSVTFDSDVMRYITLIKKS